MILLTVQTNKGHGERHDLQKHPKVRLCMLLGSSIALNYMKIFFTASSSPTSSSKMLVGFI